MSRRTEEGKKEEKAFKCYFRNSFCPFMSVLIFVCFENIGYQTDKNGHKTFFGYFCFFCFFFVFLGFFCFFPFFPFFPFFSFFVFFVFFVFLFFVFSKKLIPPKQKKTKKTLSPPPLLSSVKYSQFVEDFPACEGVMFTSLSHL